MPVYNERDALAERAPASRLPRRVVSLQLASRSPTTPAPTAPGRSRAALAARAARTSAPCTSTRRAAAARCTRSGRRATRASSPTWTSTCRPTSPRCCRWSRRCCPGTATSRSAAGSPAAPASCAARSASSSRAATTCCCARRCGTRFSDAQCGFKAMRADCARALLPLVRDTAWFFDTELLVLAERSGLRIDEVPVDWVDDPDSRVDIVATAIADLRGIARLGRALARGDLPVRELGRSSARARQRRRASAGRSSASRRSASARRSPTCCCSCCCAPSLGAQAANAVALLVTAVANTAANRRLHLRRPRRRRCARATSCRGSSSSRSAWPLTGALARRCSPRSPPSRRRAVEVTVLVAANLAATVLRFVLLRAWVFAAARATLPTSGSASTLSALRRRRSRRAASAERRRRGARRRRLSNAAARARSAGDPALGAAGAARPARRHRAALPRGTSARRAAPTTSTRPRSQAGTKSWKAFFFGSFDSSNFITVDKPPASLWVDGALGADLRLQLVVHARPAGARGRRRGRAALRHGAAPVLGPAAGLLAGARARDHAGRGADVPLQQPGRAARAAARRAPRTR